MPRRRSCFFPWAAAEYGLCQLEPPLRPVMPLGCLLVTVAGGSDGSTHGPADKNNNSKVTLGGYRVLASWGNGSSPFSVSCFFLLHWPALSKGDRQLCCKQSVCVGCNKVYCSGVKAQPRGSGEGRLGPRPATEAGLRLSTLSSTVFPSRSVNSLPPCHLRSQGDSW